MAVCLICIGMTEGLSHTGPKDFSLTNVNSISVDPNNVKWFSTDTGIVSFDGRKWKLHTKNRNLPNQHLNDIAYVNQPEGPELWIASPEGATVASLPLKKKTKVITYHPENSSLFGQHVLTVAAGVNSICWIGTDKGISALVQDQWLTPDYGKHYTERMFRLFPITSMATNSRGDTAYVGTAGAGVARVYRDDVDGISGASMYAPWGPIDMPSEFILSVFIASDGTQWFGTEDGIARHTGDITLDNWTVYTTDDGLVDNFVQAITEDMQGNIWFGTEAGISVFDGTSWTTYTTQNGLVSDHILSLATDLEGIIWIGTDAGISSYVNGEFITY
jgi:hypothetical protein